MKMLFALTILFGLTISAGLALSGSGTPQASAAILAQNDMKPIERTPAQTVRTPGFTQGTIVHPLFICNTKTCTCTGNDDCYRLGAAGVCNTVDTWGCSGNSCTCNKK